jgi:hypothetical protein
VKPELQKKLFDKYPKIFRQKDLPMTQTCMCWGVDCGNGWYNLIDTLCACIQNHVDSTISDIQHRKEYLTIWICISDLFRRIRSYFLYPRILKHSLLQFREWWGYQHRLNYDRYQVEASQVKEKYGGLRFYVDRSNETVDGMISLAEALSEKICDECGGPGRPNDMGWISTLCDSCRNKRENS